LPQDVGHKEKVIGVLDATIPLPKVDNFLTSGVSDWFPATSEEFDASRDATAIIDRNNETSKADINTFEGMYYIFTFLPVDEMKLYNCILIVIFEELL